MYINGHEIPTLRQLRTVAPYTFKGYFVSLFGTRVSDVGERHATIM